MKLIVFDFDGVFTDGKITIDNNGIIHKNYNIKDGMAFKLLRENNIQYGVISGYKSNESQYEILKHLNINYISLGSDDKIGILKNWCESLNIDMSKDVAYMGDDINDLEIMKGVNYIGCPKDAVNEVREISNFISSKNGGQGCIRDFVEHIISKKCKIKVTDEIRSEFNYQINNFDINSINNLVDVIDNLIGNIYFCGVGKSGNIAKHCSDLLKCISLPSFYFDILNSTHGDIGTLKSNDMIIMFSNSGNTQELVNLIPLFKKIKTLTVGICCKNNSKFKELCDLNIVTPFKKEISGEIDKIPTNSFMSHMIFSNILVSLLKKRISLDEYKENHPSGNISLSLLKIKDVLVHDIPIINFINENIPLHEIFFKMTNLQKGYCFFVNKDNVLLGILSDGDIRRLLLKKPNTNTVSLSDINNNFYYETNIEKYVNNCKKCDYIPILNNENKLIGAISNH